MYMIWLYCCVGFSAKSENVCLDCPQIIYDGNKSSKNANITSSLTWEPLLGNYRKLRTERFCTVAVPLFCIAGKYIAI